MFGGKRKGKERKGKRTQASPQSRNRSIYTIKGGRRREWKERKKGALIIIRFLVRLWSAELPAVILEINPRLWRRAGCCDEGGGGDIVDLRGKRKINKLKLNSWWVIFFSSSSLSFSSLLSLSFFHPFRITVGWEGLMSRYLLVTGRMIIAEEDKKRWKNKIKTTHTRTRTHFIHSLDFYLIQSPCIITISPPRCTSPM